jgi:hypothetical protein
MFRALLADELISAEDTEAVVAICPACKDEVVAKRGAVINWHWSHRPGGSCVYDDDDYRLARALGREIDIPDPRNPGGGQRIGGGESLWHRDWKEAFADVGLVEHVRGMHRADVWTPIRGVSNPGRAFEFQSTELTVAEMLDRQRTWINVVWVLRGLWRETTQMGRVTIDDFFAGKGTFDAYSWKRVPEMIWKGINAWSGAGAQIHVDLGDGRIIRVIEVEFGHGFSGASRVVAETERVEDFVARYRADASIPLIDMKEDVMGTCNRCGEACVRYGVNGNPLCPLCLGALGR